MKRPLDGGGNLPAIGGHMELIVLVLVAFAFTIGGYTHFVSARIPAIHHAKNQALLQRLLGQRPSP